MPKNMTFKDKIRTRSGKCFDGDLIYVATRDGKGRLRFVHGRRIVENQKITEHQTNFGERSRLSNNLYQRLPIFLFSTRMLRITRIYTDNLHADFRDYADVRRYYALGNISR